MGRRAKIIEAQYRAGTLHWTEMNVIKVLLGPPSNATFEEIANLRWEDIDMKPGGRIWLRRGEE